MTGSRPGRLSHAAYLIAASILLACEPPQAQVSIESAAVAAATACDPAAPGALGHPVHGVATPIGPAIACEACHSRALEYCSREAVTIVRFGALARARGAAPVWDPVARTCTGVACHGAGLGGGGAPVTWFAAAPDWTRPPEVVCAGCHGWPPASPHFASTACAGCHPETVRADGSIDVAAGRHVDGAVQAVNCDGCHAFPPVDAAHVVHAGPASGSGYGDLSTAQDSGGTGGYAFGCGLCHPRDGARHQDGAVQVELADPAAPAGSLKARAAPWAAYDAASGTCAGTYCHSSGQETPAFAASPSWRSGATLECDGCHGNPPRYPSGGAGAGDANSHVNLADDGWEFGHFLGMAGPFHGAKHGGAWAGEDAAPITCQTCHFETTDPASAGPSGFYWLDTTGAYRLPGGDPSRVGTGWWANLDCTSCHAADGRAAPGRGLVRPIRHVNGVRDVSFDPRTALPAYAGWPAPPDAPSRAYWLTSASFGVPWPASAVRDGSTLSFELSAARWDPAAKRCSNVACHLVEEPVWGAPYQWMTGGADTCNGCHPM
jgi:predicted CxxxxCH...CXXCH cytochrome family protein